MNRMITSRAARPAWITLVCLAALLALPALALSQQAAGGRTYSLDFVDSDISDVVRALAAQSGANIALCTAGGAGGAAPAAAGNQPAASTGGSLKVTVSLQGVTLEEALQVLASMTGLEWAKVGSGSTYVMGANDSIKRLKAVTYTSRVVTLRLSQNKPDYITDLLAKAAPEVICSAVPGTRSLVLTGPPAALETAASCIATLVGPDIKDAQTMVYQVKYAKCDELRDALMRLIPDLMVDLAPRTSTPMVSSKNVESGMGSTPQTEAAQGTSAGSSKFDTNTGVDLRPTDTGKEVSPITSLILYGSAETLDKAQKLLAQLDVAPKLVTINATITEIRNEEVSKLGIEWNGLGGTSGFTIGEATQKVQLKPDGTMTVTQPLVGSDLDVARDLQIGKIQRSHLSIPATINALVTKGKAKILSNPTLTLLDGRQATIHSGETIYYPVVSGYSPLGGQIVTTEEIKTGVSLAVNPRITPEGDIVMTLVPTVSDIAPSRFAGYPTIVERSVITTVRVKNGETLVLGGLVRDEQVENRSEVPVLSKIPLLGELFKSRTKQPRHTEVLIFMTPKVVETTTAEAPGA